MIGWCAAVWPERPAVLRAGVELEVEILLPGQASSSWPRSRCPHKPIGDPISTTSHSVPVSQPCNRVHTAAHNKRRTGGS